MRLRRSSGATKKWDKNVPIEAKTLVNSELLISFLTKSGAFLVIFIRSSSYVEVSDAD